MATNINFDHTSLNSPQKEECFSQNIHFMSNFVFKSRAFCEKRWKNTVERDRPQMTIWHMCIVCWTPKATKHTFKICRIYRFSTVTIFVGMTLSITLYEHRLSCL